MFLPGAYIYNTSYSPLPTDYSYTGTLPVVSGTASLRVQWLTINGIVVTSSQNVLNSFTGWVINSSMLYATLKTIPVSNSQIGSTILSQSEVIGWLNSLGTNLKYYVNGTSVAKPTITKTWVEMYYDYSGDTANNSGSISFATGYSIRNSFGP